MSNWHIRVRRWSCTSIKVSDTNSPLLLSKVDVAARRNLGSHLTRELLQWVFRLSMLSLVWPEFRKLPDSTVDDMLTCSLAVYHMTAYIPLMSCSRPRVEAHFLFHIECLARVLIGRVSAWRQTCAAKHQTRTVLADQDGHGVAS